MRPSRASFEALADKLLSGRLETREEPTASDLLEIATTAQLAYLDMLADLENRLGFKIDHTTALSYHTIESLKEADKRR